MSPVIDLLKPTAANFRAEIARHKLEQATVAHKLNMHPTLLSHYLNERRPMSEETAELIAVILNEFIDTPIFAVK